MLLPSEERKTKHAARPFGERHARWFHLLSPSSVRSISRVTESLQPCMYIKSTGMLRFQMCSRKLLLWHLSQSCELLDQPFICVDKKYASHHHHCCGLGLHHLCAFIDYRPTISEYTFSWPHKLTWPHYLQHEYCKLVLRKRSCRDPTRTAMSNLFLVPVRTVKMI